MKNLLFLLVMIIFVFFLTMCDNTAASHHNDQNTYDENSTAGLWLDTIKKLPPYLTSDLEIKFELKDSSYDIIMQETDTKKTLFLHKGKWFETDSAVIIKGSECQVLEKEGDTLSDNSDLCDTLISIKKNINTVPSPDTWDLLVRDMEFLILGMDLEFNASHLMNWPISLIRED